MEANCQAMPAIRDRAMLEGKRASHGGSERTTATHLLQGIANLDSKTEEAANAHPEVFFLSPCQGSGSALALRLSPGQPLSL